MNSFHQASLSFTGQNVGARKEERLNKILLTAIGYVLAVGVFFAFIYNVFGTTLLGLYTKSPDVIETGMNRLVIIATSYAICGMMDVVVGSLRGMGYSVVPMLVSVLGICALRLVWLATVFKMPQYHTPEMIYYTYPVSWTVTLIAHLISFAVVRISIHKKWKIT